MNKTLSFTTDTAILSIFDFVPLKQRWWCKTNIDTVRYISKRSKSTWPNIYELIGVSYGNGRSSKKCFN